MKRLFSILLTLTIFLALAVNVFGQDPGGVDSLIFGNLDGSPLPVYVDDDVVVPIWLKCDENITFIHFCLATENSFISERLGINPLGILQQWDLEGTLPVDGWPDAGFTSQSVIGIADFSLPEPNYINTNGGWLEVGTFSMHTANNPDLMGQYSQLLPGEDPLEGITLMFDEFWSPIVPTMAFSLLEFQNNRPPSIITPLNDTLFSVNCLYPFSFPIIATDEDGDDITLNLDFPYSDYELAEVELYPGYAHYLFSWTPPETCWANIPVVIRAIDEYDSNDECTTYINIQPIIVTVTADTIWPGYPTSLDINLTLSGTNSNVAGFNLVLVWDPSALIYQDFVFGEDITDWEFLNITVDPLGPSSLRLLGMAQFTEGNTPPLVQGEHLIGTLFLQSIGNPDLGGYVFPLEMPVDDFSTNVLSDSSGYLVYHPHINEGSITFRDFADVLIGDINLNLLAYEMGDVVAFVDHLIDPVGHPFNLTQRYASDCNQDGMPETIADLIFMLNVINGGGLTVNNSAPLTSADLHLNVTGPTILAEVQSEAAIGGALVKINHTGIKLDRIDAPAGSKLYYYDDGDILTAVIYSLDMNQTINSPILSANVIEGHPENIFIEYFDISDTNGNLLIK